MGNNTEKQYTFDDAIEEASKTTIFGVNFHKAAELYASKATEELKDINLELQRKFNATKSRVTEHESRIEELRKENEALQRTLSRYSNQEVDISNKTLEIERLRKEIDELEEWKKQDMEVSMPLFNWGHRQKDIPIGTSITIEAVKRLEEHKVLKESNKELVEALKYITNLTVNQSWFIDSEWEEVGKIQELILKSEGDVNKIAYDRTN